MASTIAAGTSAGTAIAISGDTSGALQLQTNGTTTAVTLDTSQNATFAGKVTSAGALTLASNGTTTAVTIDTSQNVGIGTSSPGSKLELSNNSVSVPATYTINNRGANTTETSTYNLGGTLFGAYRDSSSPSYVAGMWAERVSASAGASSSGNLVFGAMTSGTTAYPTERMRIDSSGNLLVGTTSNAGNAQAVIYKTGNRATLELKQGDAGNYNISSNAFLNSGTYYHVTWTDGTSGTHGSITSNGTNVAYNTTSDYRLKDNVTPVTGALATIAQLKPCNYKWIADGSDGQGFIAHELAEVVPDCVTGEKDAVDAEGNPQYQGIDTSFLVATLTAAIQEQQALIIQLQADVAALKGVK